MEKSERETTLQKLPALLLAWYDKNKRDLPWRENTDPYRVWVSEIMLQQTRVEAAKEHYIRFSATTRAESGSPRSTTALPTFPAGSNRSNICR